MVHIYIFIAIVVAYISSVHSFQAAVSNNARSATLQLSSSTIATTDTVVPSSPWFTDTADGDDIPKLKTQILQLGAALDRGQSYNPVS